MEFIIAFFQSQLMLGNAKYDIKEVMGRFMGYVRIWIAYCKTVPNYKSTDIFNTWIQDLA